MAVPPDSLCPWSPWESWLWCCSCADTAGQLSEVWGIETCTHSSVLFCCSGWLTIYSQAANPYVIKLSVLDDEIALHVSSERNWFSLLLYSFICFSFNPGVGGCSFISTDRVQQVTMLQTSFSVTWLHLHCTGSTLLPLVNQLESLATSQVLWDLQQILTACFGGLWHPLFLCRWAICWFQWKPPRPFWG